MKLKEIYDFLDALSPFELQEKWDNSGLIVGDFNKDIKEVVLSLDIDSTLIEEANENTLFVVHHPLIFGSLKRLDFSKYPANLLEKMILKKQSLIAMHTNFDKTHLNRYVFENVLNFKLSKEIDFICFSDVKIDGRDLINLVKEKLNLNTLRVVNFKKEINGVALTTGAGASLLDLIDVDCFLTGDIKYHDAIKALSEDKMLIDIGHFESEQFFVDAIKNSFNSLPISVIIAQSKNPFSHM